MPPLPAQLGPDPEPIPLPDLRRPERTPSLPAWLALRIASIRDVHQAEQKTGKHRMMATLPRNLTLSGVERDEIERHLRTLDALFEPTPFDDPQVEGRMLIELTKMVLSTPSATQNEASAEARGEAYLTALEDLPLWAVQAAIRRWHRGDAGKNQRGEPYDYHWLPAPAELRMIALLELWRVRERAAVLRKLLSAEPLIEFSDEHCRAMREKLSALAHDLSQFPPVGKDGSGGKVSVG
jgi:hypothetical protein